MRATIPTIAATTGCKGETKLEETGLRREMGNETNKGKKDGYGREEGRGAVGPFMSDTSSKVTTQINSPQCQPKEGREDGPHATALDQPQESHFNLCPG